MSLLLIFLIIYPLIMLPLQKRNREKFQKELERIRNGSAILFFLFISLSCDGQSGFHALLSASSENTTPTGQQVFLFLGDSNADGRGASIPTVAAATLYKWNGTSVDEITTQTVANDGSYGSIWQYFATEYKASSGKKVVGVFEGHSGAKFSHDTGDDFSTSGTYYATAVSNANAALAFLGLTKLKAVIVHLGANDVALVGQSSATINTAIDSFVSRITADFPGTPIIFVQLAVDYSFLYNTQRGYDVRKHLIDVCEANANLHIVGSGLSMIYISSAYNVDLYHYGNVGLEHLGKMFNRWFNNSSISNKWARSVVSSHFDELSSGRKALVSNFITNLYNSGDYFLLESYHNWKTTIEANMFLDWTFKGFGAFANGTGFVANSYAATNGSTFRLAIGYINAYYTGGGAGQSDFLVGVKLLTRNTASGTIAVLLSGFPVGAATGIRIGQVTTNTIYMANDNANANGSTVALASNTEYVTGRNGGTRYLYTNKTQDASNTDAVEAANTVPLFIGVNYQAPSTYTFYLDARYTRCWAAKFVGFDKDYLYDEAETMETGW